MYENGNGNGNGVVQDYAKAVEYYQLAAKQEDANAQFTLGVMYLNGTGVKPNRRIVMELLKKSCKNGNQEACQICE